MIALHTAFAIAALILGPVLLLRRKGDRRHRMLGRVFAAALFGVNVTGFGIYELTGGPSVFHALALVSLLTLWNGLAAIRRGRVATHLVSMAFAYAGLLAALGARLDRLLPDWPPALAQTLGILAPLLITEVATRLWLRRNRTLVEALERQSSCSSS